MARHEEVGRVDLLAEYRRATMFFEAGDPTGAARLLEPIIEAEPDNSSVRQLLARAYFQSAQLNRAEEQLRELVDRDPSDHYAHHVLGRTLERMNRPVDALRHLRIAAAMYSTNTDYATALRRVEGKVGR
nr:tetratricopeptide repeat protein [Micromonospora sp. ANENR4]